MMEDQGGATTRKVEGKRSTFSRLFGYSVNVGLTGPPHPNQTTHRRPSTHPLVVGARGGERQIINGPSAAAPSSSPPFGSRERCTTWAAGKLVSLSSPPFPPPPSSLLRLSNVLGRPSIQGRRWKGHFRQAFLSTTPPALSLGGKVCRSPVIMEGSLRCRFLPSALKTAPPTRGLTRDGTRPVG